jgi:hypothetical protein
MQDEIDQVEIIQAYTGQNTTHHKHIATPLNETRQHNITQRRQEKTGPSAQRYHNSNSTEEKKKRQGTEKSASSKPESVLIWEYTLTADKFVWGFSPKLKWVLIRLNIIKEFSSWGITFICGVLFGAGTWRM